jgi:hypothetical protein
MKNLISKIRTFRDEKLKPLLRKPLFWIIAIPSFFLILFVLFILSAVVAAFVSIFSASSFTLKSPTATELTADKPSGYVMFACNNIQEIKLNEKVLSKEDFQTACGTPGYKLDFQDGENIYTFVGRKTGTDDTHEITLKVFFDEKTYTENIEKQRLEKEANLEQKALEKAEKEKEKLEQWKLQYKKVKDEYISDAYKKSGDMINAVENQTNMYSVRNIAQNYKDYFRYSCGNNVDTMLANPPSIINTEDIKNLDFYLNSFCSYNELMAKEIIKYTEASTTSKQYSALDSIKRYSSYIFSDQVTIEGYIYTIDEAIK